MAEQTPIVFADILTGVKLVNGVVRVTFGSVEDQNKIEPSGTLILPFSQFQGVARGLTDAANGLISKIREAQGKIDSPPQDEIEAAVRAAELSSYDPANGSDNPRPSA